MGVVFDGNTSGSLFNPKRLEDEGFAGMLALETIEVDPKRPPTFDVVTVEVAFDGEILDSFRNPSRPEDGGFAAASAFDADAADPIDPNKLEDRGFAVVSESEAIEVDPNKPEDGGFAGGPELGALEVDPIDPNKPEDGGFPGAPESEALGKDPKRPPGEGFAGAPESEPLEVDPKRPADGGFPGAPESETLGKDPKRENELGAGVGRVLSKANGDVDSELVLGGAALLVSVPKVKEGGSGVDVAENEPGLVVDELEDCLWPKMPSAPMDFAVRDGRGEASGETLPNVGFGAWLIELVTPASDEPLVDVAIAGEVMKAGVLGEVAGMVGSV